MESFFSRYKSALVLAAVLLAQGIGLATQMRRADYASRADGHHVRAVRAGGAFALTPFETVLRRVGSGVRGTWNNYVDLRHVRQHDRDLQYQIDQLRLREASLAEDARQGQRLQQLLGFKQQYVGKTIAAQVVGTGGGDQSRLLVLDKGASEGLTPDMAVITPDGVVGKVRDVFEHSAQVLLLNDPSSGAGVVLTTTRSRGILRGTPSGTLQISNLMPDERIKPGEAVVTSGGDRIFPRGLSIGTVIAVKPDPDHQPYAAISIKPAANLDRLEEVLVVTDASEQLAAAIATGQQVDEAGKKASEVVAGRLPGLHDQQATGDTPGTNPAQPPSTALPKPPPALHTDRYSPGAVPPAADLQPGQHHDQPFTPVPRSPRTPAEEQQP
jgi:rod shape-determining protein MreC